MKWRTSLLFRTATMSGGTAIFMIGQLALLILIARLGSHTLVGAYALSTAFLNPIFLLARMGLRAALATERDGGTSFREYRDLQYILCGVATILTVGIALAFSHEPIIVYVMFVVFFAKLFETLSDLHYGLLLQNNRQHAIATSLGLRSVTSTFLYLILTLIFDAELALIALPISWALVFAVHDLSRSRGLAPTEGGYSPQRDVLQRLLRLLLPLAFAGFFGQLAMSVPRYIIGIGSGTDILGQIAPALMAHVFVSSFADAVMQSLLPSVTKEIAEGNARKAWRRLLKISMALLPLALASILAMFTIGSWAVEVVFGAGYELAGTYIGIVSVSWSLRTFGTLFGSAVIGGRNFPQMFRINLLSFFAYSAMALGLGAAVGLEGVLWGVTLGSLSYCCMMIYAAKRKLAPAA